MLQITLLLPFLMFPHSDTFHSYKNNAITLCAYLFLQNVQFWQWNIGSDSAHFLKCSTVFITKNYKVKCPWSSFESILIKMCYSPSSLMCINWQICINLGRKEHKEEYRLWECHRSEFKSRSYYKPHCVTWDTTYSISASLSYKMMRSSKMTTVISFSSKASRFISNNMHSESQNIGK